MNAPTSLSCSSSDWRAVACNSAGSWGGPSGSPAGRQAVLRVFVAMLAYPPRVELVQRS